ncbi:hypothetical protein TAMC210_02620 [Thermanaeromonas sp. C210]|nr:hypothetical protein TAMC210_02620 [Thermanaeromonas sp. C210]
MFNLTAYSFRTKLGSLLVRRHWEKFREAARETDFYVISARKAVRILRPNPRRTRD